MAGAIYVSRKSGDDIVCGCDPCALPDNITLTLAMINICGCLNNGGGISPSTQWNTTPPSGVHTLAFQFSTPDYSYWEISTDITSYDYFPLTNCAGSSSTQGGLLYKAGLICNRTPGLRFGKLSFRIYSGPTNLSQFLLPGRIPYFFAFDDIQFGVPASNSLMVCDTVTSDPDPAFPNPAFVTATGGTALIELP